MNWVKVVVGARVPPFSRPPPVGAGNPRAVRSPGQEPWGQSARQEASTLPGGPGVQPAPISAAWVTHCGSTGVEARRVGPAVSPGLKSSGGACTRRYWW